MKICIKCDIEKIDDKFLKRSDREGFYNQCIDCKREYERDRRKNQKDAYNKSQRKYYKKNKDIMDVRHFENRYGMYRGQLIEMLKSQDYKCKICRDPLIRFGDIDHDHSCCPSGKSCGKCIRGLLCRGCNRGMGHYKDDPDRLIKASNYLIQFQNK